MTVLSAARARNGTLQADITSRAQLCALNGAIECNFRDSCTFLVWPHAQGVDRECVRLVDENSAVETLLQHAWWQGR